MPETRLKEFLDKEHVKYVSIDHSPAFTAQEVAAAAHIPGRELAKSVIVKVDGELAMVVLPVGVFRGLKADGKLRIGRLRVTLFSLACILIVRHTSLRTSNLVDEVAVADVDVVGDLHLDRQRPVRIGR